MIKVCEDKDCRNTEDENAERCHICGKGLIKLPLTIDQTPRAEVTLDCGVIKPVGGGGNKELTDKQKIDLLRNAFRVTLMLACQDDKEAIDELFPESEILKAEEYISSIEDNMTLGEYFKDILAL